MTRRIVAALVILVIVIGGGAGVLLRPDKAKAEESATIEVVDRSVTTKDRAATEFSSTATGAAVHAGTRVRTDDEGLATLTYEDGSITRVGPSSTFTVERLGRASGGATVTRLDVGRTWHRVEKVATAGGFEVRTANAVAAVRGTAFGVICSTRTVCDVIVAEGAVLVTTRSGTQTVRAGRSLRITGSGELGRVVRSEDNAWVAANRAMDRGEATTTTRRPTSTSSTDTSLVTTSTGGVTSTTRRTATTGRTATTARSTTTVRKGTTTTTRRSSTTTTARAATTTTDAPETTTTAAPATTTTAAPTTTTRPAPTTDPSVEPTQAPPSIGPPDDGTSPVRRSSSALGTGAPALLLVFLVGTLWRRGRGWQD